VKLLRTIALDPSDTFVFDAAAEPGEWAVPGTFRFWSDDPAALRGKARSAFRSGFLGLQSWGWSTLVQVVDVKDDDRDTVVDLLARRLVERLGAPDLIAARRAAEEEVNFAESLCSEPVGMLIAVHRMVESGEIRETFRTLRSRCGSQPHRAFSFLEVDDERSAEEIDLAGVFLGRESK
jgi:hypothetical protein